MKKIEGKQKIADGFGIEMLILQEMYRGTGTTEYGQIGFDELSVSRGIVQNVKNNEMTGMSKDMYDVNKIMRNLLDGFCIEILIPQEI